MSLYSRLVFFLLLSALSFPASANTFYYNTSNQAQHFCNLDYQSPSYGSSSGSCPGPTVIGAISQCNGGVASRYSFSYAGNSRSYIYCQSASIYCPNNGTWSNTLQTCSTPCPPPGEQRTISVKVGTYTNDQENEHYDADIGRGFNNLVYLGGVEYGFTYPQDYNVEQGCFIDDDDNNAAYCNMDAVATGVCSSQQTDSAKDDMPNKPDLQAEKTQSGNLCVTDKKGNTVCNDSPEGNKKCGTVNGNKVCFDTTPGVGTVNGQAYKTSDKNCGFVNKQPVCVSSTGDSPTTKGCLSHGGVKACVNGDVKVKTTKETETLPDGSKIVTTTERNNIIGQGDKVTKETFAPDGTLTGTETKHEGGTGSSGSSGASGEGQGDTGTEGLNGPKTGASGEWPGHGEGFYESAYPGGFSGIWNSHKSGLQNSEFMQGLDALNPFSGMGDGGSCPTWTITLWLIGPVSTGTSYCWVFPVLRIFLLITTLFTVRAIIFGG